MLLSNNNFYAHTMKWGVAYRVNCVCVCFGVLAYPILVQTITSMFINGFQNNFAHLFSKTGTSVT